MPPGVPLAGIHCVPVDPIQWYAARADAGSDTAPRISVPALVNVPGLVNMPGLALGMGRLGLVITLAWGTPLVGFTP